MQEKLLQRGNEISLLLTPWLRDVAGLSWFICSLVNFKKPFGKVWSTGENTVKTKHQPFNPNQVWRRLTALYGPTPAPSGCVYISKSVLRPRLNGRNLSDGHAFVSEEVFKNQTKEPLSPAIRTIVMYVVARR